MGSISSLLAQSSPTQTPPLTGGLEEATEPIVLLPLGERQNDGEEEKEEKEGSQKVTKNNNANEGSRGNDDDNYDDEIPMGEGEVLPQLHEGASQTDSHDLLPPLLATPTPKGTEKTPAGSPGSPSPLSNPQQSTTGTAATVDNETQPDKPGPLKVASFVRKVYEIVNDESNKELVSWWTKGPSFVVCKKIIN